MAVEIPISKWLLFCMKCSGGGPIIHISAFILETGAEGSGRKVTRGENNSRGRWTVNHTELSFCS